jgi:predicted RNA-binding protein YlxR (DUF448 family)
MRTRHVPQRTCIQCRQVRDKRNLVRLVCTSEGQLVIDESGKRNGRGAYLCRQRSCWETAIRGEQLGQALRMEIGQDEKRVLQDFLSALPE